MLIDISLTILGIFLQCVTSSQIFEDFTLIITNKVLIGKLKEQKTVNATVPGPLINVTLGHTIRLTVINNLYDTHTVVHLHGMTQFGTPFSDGVPFVSQCLISNSPGNNSFTYLFTPEKAGTYWYHAHHRMQYSDGLYGPLVVFDPAENSIFESLGSPYGVEDPKWILMFADWYDVPAEQLMNDYLSPASGGDEPVPDAFTVNNQFSRKFTIEADPFGDPIRVRVINAGTFSMVKISVDGMPLQLIELDTTQVQPLDLQFIQLNVAQRCSFVLDFSRLASTLANTSSLNIRISVLGEMYPTYNQSAPNNNLYGTFSGNPVELDWIGTIKFKGRNYPADYTEPPFLNLPSPPDSNILEARALHASRAPQPDYYFQFVVQFHSDENDVNRAYINGYTYVNERPYTAARTVPTLFHYIYGNDNTSDYASVDKSKKKSIVGDPRSPVVLPYGKCVEMFINNTDGGEHPFHLHGHVFWIIGTNTFPNAATLYKNNYLVRDVVSVPGNGWARIRFKTTNPGVWMFHCHIPWHQAAGFVINFVVAPSRIRNHTAIFDPIPQNQIAACSAPVKRIIKLGGYFNILNPANQSQFNVEQAQSLAAFMMAVNEINQNKVLLPNFELRVAVRVSMPDFAGAIDAAEYLATIVTFPSSDASLKFVSQDNIGVDVVVGAGSDIETVAMNQIFTGRKIIQLHTAAHDSQLGVGASFPYKIATVPTNDFQGLVLHMIGCKYFGYQDVIIFTVNSLFGSVGTSELKSPDDCPWNVAATFIFSPDTTNFKSEISMAKTFNVEVFILVFEDPVMAGMLLEQGYDLGLFRQGIQIFGSEDITTPLTWQSFQDQSKVDSIMQGYIGIRYDPSYYMKTSDVGQKFIQRFRQLPSISGGTGCYVPSNGIASVEGANKVLCHKLNFSSFASDGEDIYPYAPHAYDAVYAASYALQDMLEKNQYQTLDPGKLYNMFLDTSIVSFEGVTGQFEMYLGDTTYPFQSRGNREAGHTMKILNYNKDKGGLVFVGKFSEEETVLCDPTILNIDGYECVPATYNTADGLPTGNLSPYTLETVPEVVKIGGLFQLFDSKNRPDFNQAQCLAAFLMAIKEVNDNPDLLPNTTLVSGIASGRGFSDAIEAANALVSSKFGGTGVDIVIGSGSDIETEASNQVFAQSKLIQIHTVSQAVELSQGSMYPWRIQTTPLASFQGRILRKLICDVVKLKRVAVFAINSLFGTKTLADFQSSGSACPVKVESVSVVESGQTDYSNALAIAKAAETRMFLIIFDDPVMAGRLLEQGYNMGLFRVGTAILGTEEISNHLTWDSMINKKNIPRIMKGYLGVHYSPFISMSSSPQGVTFVEMFNALKSTRWKGVNGSILCDESALDDSGDFFLYSERSSGNVICGGIDFSFFNATGENMYPFAVHVYDAVYTTAYALHDELYTQKKKTLSSSSLYNTIVKNTDFNGASGIVKFTAGNTYYPYDNRGNRENGHEYLIINFNEALYHSTTNGSGGMGYPGSICPVNGTLLDIEEVVKILPRILKYVKLSYNTEDGNPPTNPDVHVETDFGIQIACIVIFGVCFCIVTMYSVLTILFRSMKVLNEDDKQMFFFILFGGLLFSLRALVTGLDITNLTCTLKVWFGHTAFFMLYGGLFSQALSDIMIVYHNRLSMKGSQIFASGLSTRKNSHRSQLPQFQDHVQKSNLDVILSVLNNTMFFILLFTVAYLTLITMVGVPQNDFLSVYLNLETKHYSICSMREPLVEAVLYGIELLILAVGIVFCLLLRSQKDYLIETRRNPMVIIVPMLLITVVFVAVLLIEIFLSLNEDIKQVVIAASSVSIAIITILIVCTPPLYLILSLKYDRLAIHETLMNDCSVEKLKETIESKTHLMYRIDRYGQNAFQVALEYDIQEDLLLELVRYFLPFDPETKTPIPAEHHGYVWLLLVQKDSNVGLVEKVIKKYSAICFELANAVDSEGRVAVNIASQACQRIIKESTYFCQRYEITTMEAPIHVSRTCVLHLAIDHRDHGEKVALKMMKNVDQYSREVLVRREAKLSNDFIVGIVRTFDVISNPEYLEAIKTRGFMDYPYCIVMPAADRDLNRIITNEHIAGKDWGQIRSICIEVAKALQHLHSNGVIHGDVKSKNIMRSGHRVKLIDFDASVSIGKDYAGAKSSSAFVPPEMIYFNDKKPNTMVSQASKSSLTSVDSKTMLEWKQYSGKYFEDEQHIGVKTYQVDQVTGEVLNKDKLPFELVVAHDSFDTWSFGVVMFELCAGIPLFLANSEDNILYENMLDLYAFTDKYKRKRMAEIQNIEARNLVAQMLTKDPRKRPHMAQVLAHPFLSGKKAARMLGEVAEFDVFLSYRVQSDVKHAEILYDKLTSAGLKVWWDKKSLMPGVPWKQGFCDGMVKSLVFLPLLSREAINSSSVEKQNFSLLSRSSQCDNVLLEHRLALELMERGIIMNIYPVLIGDLVDDAHGGSYSDYFASGCHPQLTNAVIVESVEHALQDQLNRLCFGTPLLDEQTVPVVLDSILKNQGCLVDGPQESAFDSVMNDVILMVRQKRAADDVIQGKSFSKMVDEGALQYKRLRSTLEVKESDSITVVEPFTAATPRG